jgi:hypothetical protein
LIREILAEWSESQIYTRQKNFWGFPHCFPISQESIHSDIRDAPALDDHHPIFMEHEKSYQAGFLIPNKHSKYQTLSSQTTVIHQINTTTAQLGNSAWLF